ncbi:hypothetical protein BJV82DRAFT_714346 [Fennellomyces sp. T-0311]|nr:hypothetical protein BJV82DRAFT_714346 [Fennellomyces sp. T-0311]
MNHSSRSVDGEAPSNSIGNTLSSNEELQILRHRVNELESILAMEPQEHEFREWLVNKKLKLEERDKQIWDLEVEVQSLNQQLDQVNTSLRQQSLKNHSLETRLQKEQDEMEAYRVVNMKHQQQLLTLTGQLRAQEKSNSSNTNIQEHLGRGGSVSQESGDNCSRSAQQAAMQKVEGYTDEKTEGLLEASTNDVLLRVLLDQLRSNNMVISSLLNERSAQPSTTEYEQHFIDRYLERNILWNNMLLSNSNISGPGTRSLDCRDHKRISKYCDTGLRSDSDGDDSAIADEDSNEIKRTVSAANRIQQSLFDELKEAAKVPTHDRATQTEVQMEDKAPQTGPQIKAAQAEYPEQDEVAQTRFQNRARATDTHVRKIPSRFPKRTINMLPGIQYHMGQSNATDEILAIPVLVIDTLVQNLFKRRR